MSAAIIKDYFITDNSLRNFLSDAIPKYITTKTTITGNQSPYAKINASNDFLIRKLPEPESAVDKSTPNLKLKYDQAEFRKIIFKKLKKAEGFEPHFTVPKFRGRSAEQFVQRVFAPEIETEIQEVYENTKKIFGLRKADIDYGTSDAGGGVQCSIFRYFVDVEHSLDDISEAKITRRLIIRVSRDQIPEDFDTIFPVYVDELIVPIEGNIDFDEIVNQFENLQAEQGGTFSDNEMQGTMEYITGSGASLQVDTRNKELIITHYSPMRTLSLIDKFIEDLKRISSHKVRLLS
jgi:hypothetical protein